MLEKRAVSGLRYHHILASAAGALLLAAPLCAPAQEAERIEAAIADTAKPGIASQEVPAADPRALLDPADRAIAERIRALLAAKPSRIFASETEQAAVEAFYQKRDLAPLWLDKGAENARAKAVAARLKSADADGLDPDDYKTPVFAGLAPDALAEAELTLTQSVLTFARHVQAGRAPHRAVRADNIGLPQKAPDPAEVLESVADAADAGQALDQFSPQHEPYRKLKAALAELRGKSAGKPSGGHKNAHDRRIDTVIANMERWRWYRRDLGTAHVEVNEADFTLKVLHEGRQVWASRIVIGKPSLPTPLLSEKFVSITINPTWRVPPSIVQNEYLPEQRRRPGVLARMGLRVERKDGEVVMTLPPGGENPLGRIRFNFYNRFLVFQHDTPDQYLFAHKVRAESHGCMRVQDAPKYAEVLSRIARPDEQWTAAKVRSMYGKDEHEIDLQAVPIWIHLTYQTAFVDEAGKLQTRPDLYNLDSRTLAAIKSARAGPVPAPAQKSEPQIAAPAPAAPAPQRKVVHRAPRQVPREVSPVPAYRPPGMWYR
jgi:murein L,D-transpeptidase YcbB/YkuD